MATTKTDQVITVEQVLRELVNHPELGGLFTGRKAGEIYVMNRASLPALVWLEETDDGTEEVEEELSHSNVYLVLDLGDMPTKLPVGVKEWMA